MAIVKLNKCSTDINVFLSFSFERSCGADKFIYLNSFWKSIQNTKEVKLRLWENIFQRISNPSTRRKLPTPQVSFVAVDLVVVPNNGSWAFNIKLMISSKMSEFS